MFLLNWIISPVKMTCQLIVGNVDGAAETAANMVMSVPVLSHTLAGVVKLCGDDESASEMFDMANRNMGAMVNSVPLVGHVKGVIHYACGDESGGDEAMNSASRSATVMAAGVGGFLVGGPPGAAACGVAAGHTYDTGTVIVTDGRSKPGLYRIADNPKDIWNYVDAGVGVVGDGMAGYAGGKMAERVVKKSEIGTADRYLKKKKELGYSKNKKLPVKDEVYSEVKDLKTGELRDGHNYSSRNQFGDHVPRGENEFVNTNPRSNVKHGNNCAETQAYHKLLRDNPEADTVKTRVNTIQIKENGSAYPMEKCKNCYARADVMGKCHTDPKVCNQD